MMLHQVIVMNAALLGDTRMLRTDCFGETRLVLHIHHELESVFIIVVVFILSCLGMTLCVLF